MQLTSCSHSKYQKSWTSNIEVHCRIDVQQSYTFIKKNASYFAQQPYTKFRTDVAMQSSARGHNWQWWHRIVSSCDYDITHEMLVVADALQCSMTSQQGSED